MKHQIAALALGAMVLGAGSLARPAAAAEFDTLNSKLKNVAAPSFTKGRQPCVCREPGERYNVAGYTIYSIFNAGPGAREYTALCAPVSFGLGDTPIIGQGCYRFLSLAK